MKNLNQLKHNLSFLLCLGVGVITFAQSKHVETFNVSDDVLVTVNTSHTNVVFETWNKDKVEVEAFVDGEKLSEQEREKIFKDWKFDILGNSKKVVITSNAGSTMEWRGMESLSGMDALKELEFLGPMMENMPLMLEFKMPPLPDDVMKGMGDLQFDYEAFQKDEEGYMKKWEKEIEKRFGKDFEKKMEAWGENFAMQWNEKHGDSISQEWEQKMEAWGENFGKRMEVWGEKFGKEMEKWAEDIEKQAEKEGGNFSKQVITSPNGKSIIIQSDGNFKPKDLKSNKTIIIRMPKNAKTEINVRHGEIKMANAYNIKATLNYSPFTATSVDGGKTLISAAYAPVTVGNWKDGTLQLKFVDKCSLNMVEDIDLNANSSNVIINTVFDTANLSGSFGNLRIKAVSNDFSSLNIVLENTDATLDLPSSPFSFLYNGKKSTLLYPKSLQLKSSKNNDRVLVKGFNTSNTASKIVTINATYSNVKMQ
ncbi:hypothetical protein [Altibacter sp.]|uniref:hypothetical protein n=1 Tax=Altibacter sp. TaxID=2024823 RepID=UPI000C8FE259|nr:hypothetical protein [Altibacter sp.]MAP54545.1 hypothetical protein [Altibacter sp.]